MAKAQRRFTNEFEEEAVRLVETKSVPNAIGGWAGVLGFPPDKDLKLGTGWRQSATIARVPAHAEPPVTRNAL